MMMKAILPDDAAFHIRKRKDGRYFFTYSEKVAREHHDVMESSYRALAAALDGLGFKHSLRNGKVRVSGVGSRAQIADMIIGEFMHWSSASELTLRDIMITAAYAAAAAHAGPVLPSDPCPSPISTSPSRNGGNGQRRVAQRRATAARPTP